MLIFIVMFCIAVAVGLGLASAWSDFRGLTISNAYPLGVILAFVPAFAAVAWLAPDSAFFAGWQSHLMAMGVMFVITFILFTAGVIGAGDSKLGTAFALWVGMPGFPAFLFFMTVFGGLLGLAALVLKRWKPVQAPAAGGWVEQVQSGTSAVPYGIAIAAGAFVAFWQVGYLSPAEVMGLAEMAAGPSSFVNQ